MNPRRLLLAVTVCFLAGVAAGYGFPQVGLGWCAAGLAVCGAWVALRRKAWRSGCVGAADAVAVALALVLLGAGRVAWDAAGLARETETLKSLDKAQAFECRVASAAVARPVAGGGRMRYAFAVDGVTWLDGANRVPIRVLPMSVSWFGNAEDGPAAPKPGETWRMVGRVQVLTRTNGLEHAYLSASKGEKYSRRLSAAGDSWQGRLAQVQRETARRVALGVEDWGIVPALNAALLFGCRNEIPDDMRNVFAMSGTVHVFAVSGLHIGLVAVILIFFVQMSGLSRERWAFAMVPLIIAYTLVTGAFPSAVRACCMAVCIFLAPLLGRRPNAFSALLAAALMIHFWQPSRVFQAGSVLSFSVTAGLIVLVPQLSAFLRKHLGYHALQKHMQLLDAAGTRAQARRVRFASVVVKRAADILAVSVAAWFVSVPLTGYYFGRVPIGGLFANPIVTVCAFLIITAGFLGLLAGLASPWVAVCFNHAAGFFTMVMVRTAEAVASVKVLSLETGPWAWWAVALWFAALGVIVAWARRCQRAADGLEWLEGQSV
ncbi:MAG: ComEC/Rec2 family competence protein [Kiritimatiellaeota bacterium]|nr:ComEC/Rec2 family competence protein [Kiritimatiellota bacterium]